MKKNAGRKTAGWILRTRLNNARAKPASRSSNTSNKMRRFLSCTICVALLLQAGLASAEPFRSWAQLSPMQREALQPLAKEWDTLPAKLQKHLLTAFRHYPQLAPSQKTLFQSRLTTWSKLTPEQRTRAREKFKAFSKIKPEIREQVKQMAREQETGNPAASGVPEPAR
jgi:hypothetical protein